MSTTRSERRYKVVSLERRSPGWACCFAGSDGKIYWRHGLTRFGAVRASIRSEWERIALRTATALT